jgi:hypothetical protein
LCLFKGDPWCWYVLGPRSRGAKQIHPGYFTHISITTPVVSALKNYYIRSSVEVPTDFFKSASGSRWPFRFWTRRTAVSEVKRPSRNRFGSEAVTAQIYNGYILYVSDLDWIWTPLCSSLP